MQLKQLKTIGIGFALLLITGGGVVSYPTSVRAQLLTNQTRLVASNASNSSSFVTVEQDHPTRGTVTIVSENGQKYLEFNEAFTTANGPDVQVIFHRDNTVPVNLEEGDYVTLASLKSFNGAQRYAIPANLNIEEYGAVAIWCRQFNVTFGYASL